MRREREDLLAFYGRYLQRCNEHRFDELGEFVADDVNGPTEGLGRYIAGLHAVVDAFPDYQWELQHLLVDDQWLDRGIDPDRRDPDAHWIMWRRRSTASDDRDEEQQADEAHPPRPIHDRRQA